MKINTVLALVTLLVAVLMISVCSGQKWDRDNPQWIPPTSPATPSLGSFYPGGSNE